MSGFPCWRGWFLLLACLYGASCSPVQVGIEPLTLESLRPREGTALLLNEPIILVFSAPVDPISVTETSISLVHSDGQDVVGAWSVRGRMLRFQPRPVLDPAFVDGGYFPGSKIQLEILGFPLVNGLRSLDGVPLVQTFRSQLQVVGGDSAEFPEGTPLFFDETPFSAKPIFFETPGPAQVREGEPLRLVCEEPLNPATLDASQFWIGRVDYVSEPDGDGKETSRRQEIEHFSRVTARFARNDPLGYGGQSEPSAIIELIPTRPLVFEKDVDYFLRTTERVSLADFGGNLAWQRAPFSSEGFRVEPRDRGGSDFLRLEFLDSDGLTSTRVPWADGSARWLGGRVQATYPAVAGDGQDGAQSLKGPVAAHDVQATRLTIDSDQTAVLARGPGLRLLRTQGLLRVSGSLRRPSTGRGHDSIPLEETSRGRSSGSASAFLERAIQQDRDWTILIAGGDIVITGDVDVATPLVLIAGGRVRIDGEVRCSNNDLFLVGEGGGNQFMRNLVLALDTPARNPLIDPITFAVLSSPLPGLVRERYLWRDLQVGLEHGGGEARVRFLGADQPLEQEFLVDHPVELPNDQPLRVLIELELRPGDTWRLPVVDYVSLGWEER